jgi:outer membrane cobalamin receptor
MSNSNFRRDFSDFDDFSLIHESHESGTQFEAEIRCNYVISRWLLREGQQFIHELYRSDNFSASMVKRDRYSFWTDADYLMFEWNKDFTLHSRNGLRFEQSGGENNWLPQTRFVAQYDRHLIVNVEVGAAEAFRAPDLNSLFWADDQLARGNPNLRPETSKIVDGSIVIESKCVYETHAEITIASERVSNLIQWKPGFDGAWSPANLESATLRNLDLAIQQELPASFLIGSSASWLEARDATNDRTTGGKYLIYRPSRTQTATLRFNPGSCSINLNYKWVATRPVVDSNYKWLNDYSLLNATISYEANYPHLKIIPAISIDNITDETYRIIRFAPMPQREVSASLQISYQM